MKHHVGGDFRDRASLIPDCQKAFRSAEFFDQTAYHYPIGSTRVAPGTRIEVEFYGYEMDDGFFSGGDDEIPLSRRTVTVPSERERAILAGDELLQSLGTKRSIGNTAYDLFVYFRKDWN